MRLLLAFTLFVPLLAVAAPPFEVAGKKIYECPYLENPPYGVLAWAQSERFKQPAARESRFVDYNTKSAEGLWLDATTERDVSKDESIRVRETTFSMAYNEKGWYIYIEAEEPLIQDLLDSIVDPKSPAFSEGYEIFFTPGLHGVPYYQIMAKSVADEVSFVDWGMGHRHYRTLEKSTKVESLPLDKGMGTFIFIPWERLYEWMPLDGGYWRFSIIRWMPFAKAGGVTWGGKVHDTGNFGIVHFQPPTPTQKGLMETRVLKTAWHKFLAEAKAQTAFWSDAQVGDLDFNSKVLQPEIAKYTAAGQALGDAKTWNAESVGKARNLMPDWMEFNYKVSELRAAYLTDKLFAATP